MASVEWGTRFLDELVANGRVDAAHLGRARGMAARGDVTDVVVEPATVRAVVRGRSTLERRVHLGVRRLPADRWDEFSDIVGSSSRWVAAVLAGGLPEVLHDALAQAGLRLLPTFADISLDCSCSDSLDRCVHSAALCCHLAHALDDDPLLAVTLRGGDRTRLFSGGTTANAGAGSALPGRPPDPTMGGVAAWRRRRGELPAVDRYRRVVGRPRVGAIAPSAELGFDQEGLDRLVRDAARRADDVLAGAGGSALQLDARTDAVRRCAVGGLPIAVTAAAVGCSADMVRTLVEAWRSSALVGVEVLLAPRRLDPTEISAIEAASESVVRARSTGALLADGRQVRRSTDGTWVMLSPDATVGWLIEDWSSDLADLSIS